MSQSLFREKPNIDSLVIVLLLRIISRILFISSSSWRKFVAKSIFQHKAITNDIIKMIILYNASSNWLRKSRDRAKKTSSLPGNTYYVSPLQKYRDFSSKCMNKPIRAYDFNRDDQIINIFKMIWILLFLL